jgi:transcriptional regulator with XRE-family HTH domain
MTVRLVKTLSLVAIPISGMWLFSSPAYDSGLALISALIAALGSHHFDARKSKQETPDSEARLRKQDEASTSNASADGEESYSRVMGRRMKHIREKALSMTLREMAEFLKLDSISDLERFENGSAEYPLPLIKKLEDFFRLSRAYLDSGKWGIFKGFHLNQGNVTNFIKEGYTPILACCPDRRGDLLCYPAFSKEVDGHQRLAIADLYGSFMSSGGGRINIQYLITALLDAGKTPKDVRIVTVSREDWAAATSGNYYSRHPFFGAGSADYQCMDIFDQWFKESAASRARWKALEGAYQDN